MTHEVDVVVVGAGPAGLSAATRLRERGVGRVVVVERETRAGGVPRHCVHLGFGLRDLHRLMSGPQYARSLVARAESAGVCLLTSTTVTSVDPHGVEVTSARGVERFDARTVLLATGARERPRSARLVAGDRPAGVFTTGQLQQWTYLERLPVGRRALVVGAEHVSFSAILTLRHAGATTVGLVTDLARHQSVRGADVLARTWGRTRVHTATRVASIEGRGRVSAVVLENLETGARWRELVDTVVFSGDWIPDNELARRVGLDIDPGTRGPASDAQGRTSIASIFAAGNLLHPVESADVVSRWARDVADAVARALSLEGTTSGPWVTLGVEEPLSWAWPNRVAAGQVPDRLRLRASRESAARTLQVLRGGEVLATQRLARTTPNRSLRADPGFLGSADDGDVQLRLV